jgi:D-galactarolactone cycloisomerase
VAALSDYPHNGNVPAPTLVEYDIGDNPLRDRLLVEPLIPHDGMLKVPTGPGLGVDLDPAVRERHRIG